MQTDFIINYEGKNVTKELSSKIISISFVDKLEHHAGSLSLVLEDETKLFLADWYPKVEDKISVLLGYKDEPLLNCGNFFVGEVEFSYNRNEHQFTINALSLLSKNMFVGKVSNSFVGKSFNDVAKKIATQCGLKMKGELDGMVWTNMIDELPLSYLMRESKKLGKIMKVENDTIIFHSYKSLLSNEKINIEYNNTMSIQGRDKADGRFSSCTMKWFDPKTKSVDTDYASTGIGGGANAVIWQPMSDGEPSKKDAENWLTEKNKQGKELTISMVGNTAFLSGVAITLSGIGRFSGNYIIHEAKHTISRREYTTEITIKNGV